jgi:hypothetical protein
MVIKRGVQKEYLIDANSLKMATKKTPKEDMDAVWAMLEAKGASRRKWPSGPWYCLKCSICSRSCSGPKGETKCMVCRGEMTKQQAAEKDAKEASKQAVLVCTQKYTKHVNGKLVESVTRITTFVDPPKPSASKIQLLD